MFSEEILEVVKTVVQTKVWTILFWNVFCRTEWRALQCEVLHCELQSNGTINCSKQWKYRATSYSVSLSAAKGKGGEMWLYAPISTALEQPLSSPRCCTPLAHIFMLSVPLWTKSRCHCVIVQAFGESAQGGESVKLFLADNRTNLVRITFMLTTFLYFFHTCDFWIGRKPKMPKYFETNCTCGHLLVRAL